MTYNDYICHLKIDIDVEYLKNTYKRFKHKARDYKDSRYKISLPNCQILQHDFSYAKLLIKELQLDNFYIKPRFWHLKKNSILPLHVDNDTLCSLNFMLVSDAAPLHINNKDFYYKNCLLNTQVLHGVTKTSSTDRLLFKLSIMDETYDNVKNILIKNNFIVLTD